MYCNVLYCICMFIDVNQVLYKSIAIHVHANHKHKKEENKDIRLCKLTVTKNICEDVFSRLS